MACFILFQRFLVLDTEPTPPQHSPGKAPDPAPRGQGALLWAPAPAPLLTASSPREHSLCSSPSLLSWASFLLEVPFVPAPSLVSSPRPKFAPAPGPPPPGPPPPLLLLDLLSFLRISVWAAAEDKGFQKFLLLWPR